MNNIQTHHSAETLRDRFSFWFVKLLRLFADMFFRKRYGHRAVVLETVAAVPGMVGGMLQHLKSLRKIKDDHGWIKALLDEAENERMHLMTFVQIAQPTIFERLLILVAQGVFFVLYSMIYLASPSTAHRIVGYFEEEAVVSYTQFLTEIDEGRIEDVAAPKIAINYWGLPQTATLRDVVIAVREDEAGHRDTNHGFANAILTKTEDSIIDHTQVKEVPTHTSAN